MSLPAAYDYVSFMKVERSSYLKIRFDWMYSIYIIFAVAVIARYLWKLAFLLRGREPASIDGTQGPLRTVNLTSPFAIALDRDRRAQPARRCPSGWP